jgi:peptidoglycan/xylan/chitin deacetylase (PgdA/CDA1 family)
VTAPDWLGRHQVAVSLTFDVDADVGFGRRGFAGKLTSRSEARYGAVRGLARILDLLQDKGVTGTFYVPGEVVDLHPDLLARILEDGHEVGHHGYAHLFTDRASEQEQRDELEHGLDAIQRHLGVRPTGFRSPGWELTPYTLRLLVEAGFDYDSSCMGDDRPYVESCDDVSILELPVHWSLDDWPFFGFRRDAGGQMASTEAVQAMWLDEFRSALQERRQVTYTMHPEVIGRGHRALMLGRLIDAMRVEGDVWFARHADVSDAIRRSGDAHLATAPTDRSGRR